MSQPPSNSVTMVQTDKHEAFTAERSILPLDNILPDSHRSDDFQVDLGWHSWHTVPGGALTDLSALHAPPPPRPINDTNMSWTDPQETEAFVERIRLEATVGVQHFADLPHHAGTTKTALALTLLAYTADKRDGLKPRRQEMASITSDLNWTKYELAKRELEQQEELKKLRVDLRWAKFQLAKKEGKESEMRILKAELEAQQQKQRKMENKFFGAPKVAEFRKHINAGVGHLKEQMKHNDNKKPVDASDEFQKKVEAMENAIDTIEQHFNQKCQELQTQLDKANQEAQDMRTQHAVEQYMYEQKADTEMDKLKSEHQKEKRLYDKKVESFVNENGLLKLEKAEFSKSANESNKSQRASQEYMKSIRQMEAKLAIFEEKASKNEQHLKKEDRDLQNKLAAVEPLMRFIEERDFSDEQRVELSWDEMTHAMRAAAAGLSTRTRQYSPGYVFLVEEALRAGSLDLVRFAEESPGRFVLQYNFFEAVEAIVENLLWETQKFQNVRNQLQKDSMAIRTAALRRK